MNESAIRYLDLADLETEWKAIKNQQILLVLDKKVVELYGEKFPWEKWLEGKEVVSFVTGGGEASKTFAEYQRALEFFLEAGVTRKAHLIAIGGGATSDLAGFVAATLLRGVSWSVVATTLLSAVDAAIGGKVGINSDAGKNLVGAFHFPENIWLVPDFFNTLPLEQEQSGLGEIFKYGFLDRSIAELVTKKRGIKEIIRSCVDYKKRIVDQDPHEEGARRILNLGHTFGHGFEVLGGLPHGLAVYLGMDFVFRLFGSEKPLAKLKEWAELYQMPSTEILYKMIVSKNPDFSSLWKLVAKDKKGGDKNRLMLVTVRDIAYHVQEEMDREILKNKAEVLWKSL